MKKAKYNRASGGVSVEDVFAASQRVNEANGTTTSGTSGGVWNSVFDHAGDWLSTIGQTITGSIAAKNPAVVEDNTPKVLAIAGVGVAAVVLIIALLVIFKK